MRTPDEIQAEIEQKRKAREFITANGPRDLIRFRKLTIVALIAGVSFALLGGLLAARLLSWQVLFYGEVEGAVWCMSLIMAYRSFGVGFQAAVAWSHIKLALSILPGADEQIAELEIEARNAAIHAAFRR